MNTTRAPQLLILLAAVVALGGFTATARAEDADPAPDPNRPGAKRPGFYLGLDVGGIAFDLDDVVSDRFTSRGVVFSDNANGGGLAAGYSWRNEFALELQFFGADVSTGRTDLDAGLTQAAIAFRVPLLPSHRLAPYLGGHLGGVALRFSGSTIGDQAVLGGSTGLAAGMEVHLGRRWAVDFGYQFSLVDFQREAIDVSGDGTEEFDIEGTGRLHRWAIRTTFSF
jgi:opacity protein-like surface antigen